MIILRFNGDQFSCHFCHCQNNFRNLPYRLLPKHMCNTSVKFIFALCTLQIYIGLFSTCPFAKRSGKIHSITHLSDAVSEDNALKLVLSAIFYRCYLARFAWCCPGSICRWQQNSSHIESQGFGTGNSRRLVPSDQESRLNAQAFRAKQEG